MQLGLVVVATVLIKEQPACSIDSSNLELLRIIIVAFADSSSSVATFGSRFPFEGLHLNSFLPFDSSSGSFHPFACYIAIASSDLGHPSSTGEAFLLEGIPFAASMVVLRILGSSVAAYIPSLVIHTSVDAFIADSVLGYCATYHHSRHHQRHWNQICFGSNMTFSCIRTSNNIYY